MFSEKESAISGKVFETIAAEWVPVPPGGAGGPGCPEVGDGSPEQPFADVTDVRFLQGKQQPGKGSVPWQANLDEQNTAFDILVQIAQFFSKRIITYSLYLCKRFRKSGWNRILVFVAKQAV